MISKSEEQDSELMKKLTAGFGAIYYFFAESQANIKANLHYSSPNEQAAFKVWNMLEDKLVKGVMKVTLPSIKYCKKVYIYKTYKSVNLKLVQKMVQTGDMKKMRPDIDLEYPVYLPNEEENELVLNKMRLENNSFEGVRKKGPEKVPIRILSPKELVIPYIRKQSYGYNTSFLERDLDPKSSAPSKKPKPRDEGCMMGLFSFCGPREEQSPTYTGISDSPCDPAFDGIIIHLHGGGFVSMSSASH
mmetsp:Transcript_12581/g.10792  ORF Transcript_12581/g.10792 Transcript_12581/m.10792 type:complete len:246 (+) Transcript_12581:524-1261(+)